MLPRPRVKFKKNSKAYRLKYLEDLLLCFHHQPSCRMVRKSENTTIIQTADKNNYQRQSYCICLNSNFELPSDGGRLDVVKNCQVVDNMSASIIHNKTSGFLYSISFAVAEPIQLRWMHATLEKHRPAIAVSDLHISLLFKFSTYLDKSVAIFGDLLFRYHNYVDSTYSTEDYFCGDIDFVELMNDYSSRLAVDARPLLEIAPLITCRRTSKFHAYAKHKYEHKMSRRRKQNKTIPYILQAAVQVNKGSLTHIKEGLDVTMFYLGQVNIHDHHPGENISLPLISDYKNPKLERYK